MKPPVAPGGSSFARCHPRPRAVVRQGSRLVWLRGGPMRCTRTRRSGAARGRFAGSPKTAAPPVHPHPPARASRDRPASTTRTPKGTRRPRCAVTPKGTVANAGGGSRGSIPRRRSVSPEGARSPAIAAIPKNVATPGTPLCDSASPGSSKPRGRCPRRHPKVPPRPTWTARHRSALAARRQEPNRRATRVAPRMECSIRTELDTPEGESSRRAFRATREGGRFRLMAPAPTPASWRWPASGQTDIVFIETARTPTVVGILSTTRRSPG